MPRSITIRTIGDFLDYEHRLSACCNNIRCRRYVELDLAALTVRLGREPNGPTPDPRHEPRPVASWGGAIFWEDSNMNRHGRHKVRALRLVLPLTAKEASKAPRVCAWGDCEAFYQGDMPRGWRNLVVFWVRKPSLDVRSILPGARERDTLLCPEHARELDGQLKDMGRWAIGPAAGKA